MSGHSKKGKDQLLKAAIEEFSKQSFDSVSLVTLSKRTSVTQPLIHYHFKNKNGLWRESLLNAKGSDRKIIILLELINDTDRVEYIKSMPELNYDYLAMQGLLRSVKECTL